MASQKAIEKLTFETVLCSGCRSCELACSFHHSKKFQPPISSIEIKTTPVRAGFTATLYKVGVYGHVGCDRCIGLPVPMCVQFCPAVSRKELEDLLEKSNIGIPADM
jgi:Fe-S-cluster-containing dehydrogenase component